MCNLKRKILIAAFILISSLTAANAQMSGPLGVKFYTSFPFMFFDEQTAESLAAAIERFETKQWDQTTLVDHANKFSTEVFAASIREFVENALAIPQEYPLFTLPSDRSATAVYEA